MQRFLPIIVFVALSISLAVGLKLNPALVDSPLIDKPMPTFNGTALLDTERSIKNKNWIGRPSLINIWASWCVACLDEHPFLIQLQKHNAFPILGINYKDTREDALRWLKDEGNPYREIVHDGDGAIGIEWGVYGVPESYLVDAQGIIRYKHVGPIDDDVLRNKILPFFKKHKAPIS